MMWPMENKLVVVSGNLGSGKTSLVEGVCKSLDWHAIHESVKDNPYLVDFYANKRAWSFQLEMHFLGHRAKEHLRAAKIGRSAIMDRSVYEDANVFAKALP